METYHQLRLTLRSILQEGLDPVESAAALRALFQDGLGLDAAELARQGHEPVAGRIAQQAREWARRLAAGEPLPMILGWAPFAGRRFAVNRHVMIPRPHSERALREALAWGRERGIRTCVDVGTGCGNLAISLALETDWHVAATECSTAALAVARRNARALGANVTFLLGSLLEPLPDVPDLVVANLPYVDPGQRPILDRDLAHEPEVALVSPERGTALNEAFIQQAWNRGIPAALLELGPGQGHALLQAARQTGWTHARRVQDALGEDHLLFLER